MADHKDIDDKIRGSFESVDEKAPKAPDAVWEGVEKQLTIDRAWKGVRGFLVRRTWRRRLARIAAVLLLLIGIASGYYGLQGEPDGKSTSDNANTNGNKSGNAVVEPVEVNDGMDSEDNVDVNDEVGNGESEVGNGESGVGNDGVGNGELGNLNSNANSNTNRNRNRNRSGNTDGNGNLTSDKEDETQTGNGTQTPTRTEISSSFEITPADQEESMQRIPSAIFFQDDDYSLSAVTPIDTTFETSEDFGGFEIGVTGGYQMTMVFNNETRQSFDSESLVLSDHNFLPAFGISMGYRFNRNHAVMADVHLYHKINQSISVYREGMLIDRSVSMNQQRLSLTYEYSFNRKESVLPPELYLRAGLYGGRISYISQGEASTGFGSAKKIAPAPYFKNWDLGAVLCLGKHIQLTDGLLLDLELRSTQGLNNLFTGLDGQPSDFNRTTTLTFGGHAAIKYQF